MIRILLCSTLLFALSACGGDPQGKSTTKLDAVEVQPGTISDSMIILDNAAGDGTAVDNSVPGDAAKGAATKSGEDTAENTDEESTGPENPDAVEIPAGARKAVADPSAKKGE